MDDSRQRERLANPVDAENPLRLAAQVPEIRQYLPSDEHSWLQCRVLSFLDTCYFDDVVPAKPCYAEGAEFVAVDGEAVVALLDVAFYETFATIETIAVHPDHQRQGLATQLLDTALAAVRAHGLPALDAWTREDVAALRWYANAGFREEARYVHVYAGQDEVKRAVGSRAGLAPVSAFLHGRSADEQSLRAQFSRVYLCRRLVLDLSAL